MIETWLRALARVGRERRMVSSASARWHAVLLAATAASASASSPPPLTPPDFPLLSEGSVTAVARRPDGDFVVAGAFISINGTARNGIALVADDGTLLDPGAMESFSEAPRVLAVDTAGDVYVAGGGSACIVQKFDGATGLPASGWSCSEADGDVHALVLGADDGVYVGGEFTAVGAAARNRVVKLDPSTGSVDATWNPNADGTVFVLAADADGSIYAGGDFATIGGQARAHIAKLAGTGAGVADAAWNPSANNTVYALARDAATSLYAGGSFTSIGGRSRAGLAKLTAGGSGSADATWNPSAVGGDVRVIALDSTGAVYAGGDFQTAGGALHERLVKLSPNGTGAADASWNASASDTVYALTFDAGDSLYVGGEFALVDGETHLAFAKLAPDGSVADFSADAEIGGYAFAFAAQPDGGTIVGGNFRKAGQDVRWNLLRLAPDRTLDPDWAPVFDDEVDALLATPDGSVYAGGLFNVVDSVSRSRLVRLGATGAVNPDWNPSPSSQVAQLARAPDGAIYAAGGFSTIGGQPRSSIAKLAPDGTGAVDAGWNATLDSIVRALAVGSDGAVYVGGDFMHAGGLARSRLAKLDGTTGATDPAWNPSADSFVFSLAIGGDGRLYAGGAFSTIGGLARPSLARIDASGTGIADSGWNAQASGSVFALGIDADGDVYAGGSYDAIGGQSATGLARLSGATGAADPAWIPSVNGFVISLGIGADHAIDVGGGFDTIAGAARSGFAVMPPAEITGVTLTIASVDPEPSHVDESYTVTVQATAPSGTPTGTVTVSDDLGAHCEFVLADGVGICTLASAASGLRTLSASYVSDNVAFENAVVTGTHQVVPTAMVAIVADTPDPSELLQSFAIDVHVAAATPGDPMPTGTVDLSDGLLSCSATLDPSGNATCSVFAGIDALGTRDWIATYSGDANYDPATSAPSPHTIVRESADLTVSTTTNSSVTTEPVTFTVHIDTADASPTGTITIGDGTSSCTVDVTGVSVSCDVAFTHAGERAVVATYSGDELHAPSMSQPITQTVTPAASYVMILSHTPEPSLPGQPVTVTAVAGIEPPGVGIPPGPIAVNADNGAITCTIAASGGSCDLVLTTRGAHQIEVGYIDPDFQASSATVQHHVNQLPIATPDTYESYEDTPLAVAAANGVLANDADPDGDALTVVNTGVQTATGIGGTVTLNADGSFSYTSPPNANGTAGFTYTVSDGLETATGSVTLTVHAVNDPPTFTLAPNPAFAPGTTGNRTVPAFATMTSSGPPDEHDAVLAWHVRTVSDPNGVLGAPAAIAVNGTLSAMLSGQGGVATLAVALQDDGGTDHGGQDTSPEQTFTISVGVGADLSVAIEDGTSFVDGGDAVGYTVTVRNAGPDSASGAHVQVALSSNLVDAAWTCAASAGAACAAQGSGEIHDTVNLPAGANVVYTLTATVLADPEQPAEVDATVAPPGGTVDFDPTNDSASDVNVTGIFADGFDTPEAQREEEAAKAARRQ